jgi:glycosyltransferase involved in cell wall biosynthesis
VITTDPADAAELGRRRGVRRVAQIPIGSNIALAPPADYNREGWRQRLGLTPQDFLLGYFGFLNESKGGDTLIRALATLVERKARVRLMLIGAPVGSSDATNAAYQAEIDRLIRRYDVGDRIVRTGFVRDPEVSAYLLACDAVALPYRDGASLRRGSLMAALAHGCAVITTQPQQPVPALRDGDTVRLVPPDSPEALVLAVTELLQAPEMRQRLGQAARSAAAQFAWPAIARATLAFYAQALRRASPGG